MKSFFSFVCLAITLVSAAAAQVVQHPDIAVEELRAHVSYLASAALKGRKPGTPGADSSAAYIREELRQAGVTLLGNDGFQSFEITTGIKATTECRIRIDGQDGMLDKDFRPISFSGNEAISAPVVWAGYGFDFEKDKSSWRDYEGLDVAGKWVIILRGSPDDKSGDYDPFIPLRVKALAAKDRGAAGIMFVSGPAANPEDKLVELVFQQQDTPMDIPVISVRRTIAEKLLAGKSIGELEAALNREKAPVRAECSGEFEALVDLIPQRITAHNVVGFVQGSDPVLKDEYVLIGAHYDHLGMGGPGSGSRRPDTSAVHNGADDNASGTAAAIEVIERIAASRSDIRRSVVVALFTAEEMGLLGAKEFTRNPPLDLTKARLMCNLDMVGRMDTARSLSIGGVGTAVGLQELVQDAANRHGVRPSMSPEGFGPSDHAAFYAKDIPVLFFFTGVHDDYHTPDDDADRLNYEGHKLVSDLVFDIVRDAANRDGALAFQEAGPKSRPEGSRRFKVTLGIMPDVSSSDGKGLKADAVMKGRPADLAGMKKGDIIVAMEGKPVTGVYDYMSRLAEFTPGQRISIEVLRGSEKVVLIVEL
ncbi:MAG: M20/M25/M40 family metallo-hydrolase [Bacteroidia bacterium]|nr:M20/M25/M40 family metallo-hydrolase [Bacteroidia bacterium]